jgi:hypothetical protein
MVDDGQRTQPRESVSPGSKLSRQENEMQVFRAEAAPRGLLPSPLADPNMRSQKEMATDSLGGRLMLIALELMVRMRGLEPPLPCEN